MDIEVFKMERMQSTWENAVDYNLSESGVHPLTLKELLDADELEALRRVPLGYTQTNGTPELRANVARLYPGIGEEGILTTAGSSEANFLLMWSRVSPGDEVLFELPNYMQMWGLLRAFGARVKPFRLRPELGWQPDLDELGRLASPKTKLIVLTNPNNPTGSVLSEASMAGIAALAERTGAWILADEVYQGAERDGRTTPSFWGRTGRVLCVNGLSKAYGLPGLRIGWVAGPDDVVRRVWPYHDYTTISPSALSDSLARLVLAPGRRERILERTRGILRANFPVLEAWLRGHGADFEFRPPAAGAICFAKYAWPVGSTALVERVMKERSVLLVPGDHFETDGWLRFGFGSPAEYLRAALARVDETLGQIGRS